MLELEGRGKGIVDGIFGFDGLFVKSYTSVSELDGETVGGGGAVGFGGGTGS